MTAEPDRSTGRRRAAATGTARQRLRGDGGAAAVHDPPGRAASGRTACRRSGNWPCAWGSAATPSAMRSSRCPRPATWWRGAAATAALSCPNGCRRPTGSASGRPAPRSTICCGCGRSWRWGRSGWRPARTLTRPNATTCGHGWTTSAAPPPRTIGGWTPGCTWRSPRRPARRHWCRLVAENRMRVNALLDRIPLLQRNIAHSNEQHEAIVVGDPGRGSGTGGRGDAGPPGRLGRPAARLPRLISRSGSQGGKRRCDAARPAPGNADRRLGSVGAEASWCHG